MAMTPPTTTPIIATTGALAVLPLPLPERLDDPLLPGESPSPDSLGVEGVVVVSLGGVAAGVDTVSIGEVYVDVVLGSIILGEFVSEEEGDVVFSGLSPTSCAKVTLNLLLDSTN